jgi:hypothetical protein
LQDFTLPSVGASFKKWGCCIHTPQEAQALATCKGPKKIKNKRRTIFFYKNGLAASCQGRAARPTDDRWLPAAPRPRRRPPRLSCYHFNFFAPLPHFFLMWSTRLHWLQHMPAWPDLAQKLQTPITFDL